MIFGLLTPLVSLFSQIVLFCDKGISCLCLMQLLKETPPDGDKFAKAVEVQYCRNL